MRRVYLAMFSFTGRPDAETQQSLVETTQDLMRAGIDMKFHLCVGDSILPRARNRVLAEFLASGCDDLVMLDDDMAWEDAAVRRILSHDCDLVGGTYPTRADPIKFPIKRLTGGAFNPQTGLLEVRMLPTGFLRISRKCAETMVAAHPELAYRDRNAPGGKAHALFWFDLMPSEEGGELPEVVGEDYRFCMRWRDLGGKVYCDTLLRFRHIGRKAFEGCYAETLPLASLVTAA
jgi:hypothetical protein